MSKDSIRDDFRISPERAPGENLVPVIEDRANEEPTGTVTLKTHISTAKDEDSKTNLAKSLNFSIENILSRQSSFSPISERVSKDFCLEQHSSDSEMNTEDVRDNLADLTQDSSELPWLQYTRYKPPKLQRIKKRAGPEKRKVGRNPRIPFTQHQVTTLEQKFRRTHYLSGKDVADLSTMLNLTENRVKIWFQNRRARERRDRESALRVPQFAGKPQVQHMTHIASPWQSRIPSDTLVLSHLQQAFQFGKSAFNPFQCMPLSGDYFKN